MSSKNWNFFTAFSKFSHIHAPHRQECRVQATNSIPIDSPPAGAGVAQTPAPQKCPQVAEIWGVLSKKRDFQRVRGRTFKHAHSPTGFGHMSHTLLERPSNYESNYIGQNMVRPVGLCFLST